MHTSFFPSYQQLIFCQQIKKCIPANGYVSFNKEWLQHHQQLAAAASGLLFADEQHLLQDHFNFTDCGEIVFADVYKSLS